MKMVLYSSTSFWAWTNLHLFILILQDLWIYIKLEGYDLKFTFLKNWEVNKNLLTYVKKQTKKKGKVFHPTQASSVVRQPVTFSRNMSSAWYQVPTLSQVPPQQGRMT